MSNFPPPGFAPGKSQVAGIEVYLPITKSTEKRPDVMDFKCPKCGATITYSVDAGQLVCEHCGYSETPEGQLLGRGAEQFEFDINVLLRSQQGWGSERKDMACQRCGAVVSMPPDTLAYTCPFCASNKVLYREPMEDVLRPRFLIPFKINPQNCHEIALRWLGSSWLLPKELRTAAVGKFTPIYIPYWTFDAVANATWQARVAVERTEEIYLEGEEQQYTKTIWRDESGKAQKAFSGLLVPGTTRLNMSALGKMDNFNLSDLILYEPRFLVGMQAQSYDLPLEAAWDTGRLVLRERTRRACLDRASATNMRDFRMSLDFSDEQWRYILVPVYTSVYQYGENTYQILVNGQTGKIAGPRPVDWLKLWLVVAAILSPGILTEIASLFNQGTDAGDFLAGFGIFLLATGLVFTYFLLRQAMEMENV